LWRYAKISKSKLEGAAEESPDKHKPQLHRYPCHTTVTPDDPTFIPRWTLSPLPFRNPSTISFIQFFFNLHLTLLQSLSHISCARLHLAPATSIWTLKQSNVHVMIHPAPLSLSLIQRPQQGLPQDL